MPRRNWTRLTEMIDDLDRNYSAASYVFRQQYFFTDLPRDSSETSNITFLTHRTKVHHSLTTLACRRLLAITGGDLFLLFARYVSNVAKRST